jgi:pSer/pThr/pTyr-binding forkhead associated (FHA) protein
MDEPTETYFFNEGDSAADTGVQAGTGFVVTDGPIAGSRFLIDQTIVTLGRHPKSDFFFDDITVSRRHAEVTLDGGQAKVKDVGSLNGTYVNLTQIDDEVFIEPGDILQIGKFKLVFFQESK